MNSIKVSEPAETPNEERVATIISNKYSLFFIGDFNDDTLVKIDPKKTS